jgi:uncharacterized protein
MNYRKFGRTGLDVSEIGFGGAPAGLRNYLGAWEPEREESSELISQAITRAVELGINYFDTAPGYGDGASERMFGSAIHPYRDRVILATKLFAETAEDVLRSVEASMERLQVAHLDVIQIHGGWYSDEAVDRILAPGGVLSGLEAVKSSGLVRNIGFTTEGVNGPSSRLINTGAFDVMQICYNLIYQHPYDPIRKAGALFEAESLGMGIITMRSLTSGIFQKWLGLVFPDGLGDSLHQERLRHALLSFVLSNPLIDCALVGMRTALEVEANVAACEDLSLRLDLDWMHERYV